MLGIASCVAVLFMMASGRFAAPFDDNSEGQRRLLRVPIKTKQATAWGISAWTDWASARGASGSSSISDSSSNRAEVTTDLLEMSVEDFAYWLGKFVLEVRKQDGSEYPPKTLYGLVCCFKRHFEENNVFDVNPLNTNDSRFGGFRQTLDAEMQRLHRKGLGTTKKQAEPITPDEETILWTSGQLGCHSAHALLNTVYFYNGKVFGLRSNDEHHQLQCEQYSKHTDEHGKVYLQFAEFGSKTNQGGLKHMKLVNKTVRQYEQPDDPDHCIVHIFDRYLSLLPSRDAHFYFRPLPNLKGVPRFAKQAVGRNRLSKLIPDMCKAAGIEGYKTGHSAKVTCATTLFREGFDDQLIKERTGHRSLDALHQYKRTGSNQQQQVSLALAPAVNVKQKPKIANKENVNPKEEDDDDDDFKPLRKKPKASPTSDVKGMFPRSHMTNCTFNITISK